MSPTFRARPARVSLGQLKLTWVLGDLGVRSTLLLPAKFESCLQPLA
jgi:hypothetical protein